MRKTAVHLDLLACALLLSATIVATAGPAFAQEPEYQAHPREFVRVAIYNELHAKDNGERYMWKDRDKKPKGTTTKLVIETKQGQVGRLLSVNGQPLTSQQRAQDNARVNHLLNDPSALRKKQQQDKEDDVHTQRLLAAIPDAFNFTYAGVVEGRFGKEVHYTFVPNPNFNPPNHESKVFQGMKGDLFVNIDAKRIEKIDARLFEAVDFGWGILGRLDPGGQFLVEQSCLGNSRWDVTHEILHFTGKALMFHTINIDEDETLFDFQHVPANLTLAQGVDLLKKSDDVVAQNGGGTVEK